MIKSVLYDINNKKYIFNNILDFGFRSQVWSPCAFLEINFNTLKNIKFTKIKLYFDDCYIFSGEIENQIIYKTNLGTKTKILAKSKANILCNLKAKPISYNNISLKNILDKYILPHGFLFDRFNELDNSDFFSATTLENFVVLPETSHWDVLKLFLDRSLKLFPFSIDNKIMTSNYYLDSNIIISNQMNHKNNIVLEKQNFNYLELFLNLKNNHKKNINSFDVFVLIPGLLPAEIGQKICISDDLINNNLINNTRDINIMGHSKNNQTFVVKKLDYVFKNNELMTYLFLSLDNK